MSGPDLPRRRAAEALGTFALVVAGCGAVAVGARYGVIGHGGVAAAFGLVVAAMVFALGHLSGAHLNPAVTLAFTAGRHFPRREVVPYVLAQLAGAALGALALRGLFGTAGDLGVTRPSGVSDVAAAGVEAGLTAVLVAVILAVATDTRAQGQLAALAVGITVGLEALVMGPVTGASMNPARSFGPALAVWDWSGFWIYLAGPVLGGVIGTGVYELLRGRPHPAGAPPDAVLDAAVLREAARP